MRKRSFRAVDASERLPNYPSLAEFRLSRRAMAAGIGAALIASCSPFVEPTMGDPAMPDMDAGEADASGFFVDSGGIAPMPLDSGVPRDNEPSENVPDAGE